MKRFEKPILVTRAYLPPIGSYYDVCLHGKAMEVIDK